MGTIGSYDDYVRLKGGVLHKKVSVSDPCGNFYVQCFEHPQYCRRIDFSRDPFLVEALTRDRMLYDAQRIIDECPQCVALRKPEIIVVGPGCAQEEHDACGCPQ